MKYDNIESTISDMDKLKDDMTMQSWKLAESKAKEMIYKEKIKKLEKIFNKIESKTKTKKEDIIKKLQEDQNKYFQQFVYINKINHELETLEKDINAHHQKIKQLQASSNVDEQNKLIDIQTKIGLVQDIAYDYRKKTEEIQKFVELIVPKLQELNKSVGFSEEDETNEANEKKTIADLTTDIFKIENRIVDFIAQKNAKEKKGELVISVGSTVPKLTKKPRIIPPTTSTIEEDYSDAPLTRYDLDLQTQN